MIYGKDCVDNILIILFMFIYVYLLEDIILRNWDNIDRTI